MTESVQDLFKSGDITEFAVTLDKVTVQHRSFTVLLTFFFHGGTIFCLLNDLVKMNMEEYSAEGTAVMVSNKLQQTLGLSRTLLAGRLLHFAYDGVYALREQRVAGGGCLDLPAAVAEELGLEEGSLTGTWDFAHNLQIIWKNGLAVNPMVEDLIALVFSSMDEFRSGPILMYI